MATGLGRRWVLLDVNTGYTYTLPRNPKTMTSPGRPHQTTSSTYDVRGVRRALRAPDALGDFQFQGTVRSPEEYVALQDFSYRAGRMQITDHFGRVHEVYSVAFEPVARERNGNSRVPWLFDYTYRCRYIRRVS